MLTSTECLTDLYKLNLDWCSFKLKPVVNTASAASKNNAGFISGQNWLENNHLIFLYKLISKYMLNSKSTYLFPNIVEFLNPIKNIAV